MVAPSGQDEAYEYDGLYQLSDLARGTLNISRDRIGAIPDAEEQFTYDPTGNWDAYVRKSDGSVDLDQTRVNNKDNQVTQIDLSSDGIAHDLAGNTTQMPPDGSGDWSNSLTLTWDAWNRITKVEDGATEVSAYQYDGLYRRSTKTVSGVTRHCYYSNRWKPLEERTGASTDAERQYLWGVRPNHRDELILRDRKTGALPVFDERLYCAMDYFSPTAVFDKLGVVHERYGFSGFGIRRVMAPDFSARGASSFAVEFGFQGQFLEGETGWYDYGFRYLSPEIGRWASRDLIQESGGANIYAFVNNRPLTFTDRFGKYPYGYPIDYPPPLQPGDTNSGHSRNDGGGMKDLIDDAREGIKNRMKQMKEDFEMVRDQMKEDIKTLEEERKNLKEADKPIEGAPALPCTVGDRRIGDIYIACWYFNSLTDCGRGRMKCRQRYECVSGGPLGVRWVKRGKEFSCGSCGP